MEREKFEEWARSMSYSLQRNASDRYCFTEAAAAWIGWQARAALDKDGEPVARMLTWRGPSHTPTPPRAARTYAEFPEDAALPANKEAYWENAEPLYAARPGGQG